MLDARALMLGSESVGAAAEGLRYIGVRTVKGTKARIQILVGHVGIVMIWHQVQPRKLFRTLASCYTRRHMVWAFSKVLPVQEFIFTYLLRKWGALLILREMCISRIDTSNMSRLRIRLRLSDLYSLLLLFFYSRNLCFLSQLISQGQIGLVCSLRVVELTFDTISALFI